MLKKSPFELHFGRKANTVWSQARNIFVQSDTSAQGLERNLLTPDQIDSNDYSRDRAKVVPRGSSSPTLPTRFKPLFSLDGNVADTEPYKALADPARAANKWPQFKRNLPPDGGKLVLKELATRHSDLAHSLKSGLNTNTLRFSAIASPPGAQVSSRRAPVVQPRRLSRTIAPNTIADRIQASNSTSRGAVSALSTPMVDLTVDSSSESSIGSNNGRQVARDSITTGKRQRFQCDSPPVRFAHQFASTSTPHTSTRATYSRNIDSTQQPDVSFALPQPRSSHHAVSSSTTHPAGPPEVSTSRPQSMVSSPEKEVSKDMTLPSHSASSELPSSYPSLSLPAQPVVDDAESVRTSHRSKKPTHFFGNPLRHSVKSVEEDQNLPSETTLASPLIPVTEEQNMPSDAPVVSTSSPRKQLIRDRFPLQPSTPTSSSLAQRKETTGTD